MKRCYITEPERVRCRKVAEAFTELYEQDDILVMDAGGYGYVMLQYYRPPEGFDDVKTFTDSGHMFEELWEEWFNSQLLALAKGTPMSEMGYDEIFQCLPKEKQKELLDRKSVFAAAAGME